MLACSQTTAHQLQTRPSDSVSEVQGVYYVSRMLGHADIGLTVSTYGSWLNPTRPGALDVLDRTEQPATEAVL